MPIEHEAPVPAGAKQPAERTSGRIGRRVYRLLGCAMIGLIVTMLLAITARASYLERPFMRLLGATASGVKDHPTRVIVAAVAAAILVWALIGGACLVQTRRRV